MSKSERLALAEEIAEKYGNYPIFQQNYTYFRQHFDIEVSIELALDAQNLYQKFIEVAGSEI